MRLALLVGIALIGFTSEAMAEPNYSPALIRLCMKAQDFNGCVKTLAPGKTSGKSEACINVRKGLAIVKERLITGTSLAELNSTTNPLSDSFAAAKSENGSTADCSQLMGESQAILDLIRILKDQWKMEIELGTESHRQGTRVFPAPPTVENINIFNTLAGGSGIAITGPGKILGFSDTTRQGFDYEVREWRGSWAMPCSENIRSENWCGNYVVVSPKNRMLNVIRTKIEATLNGTQPNWSQRD